MSLIWSPSRRSIFSTYISTASSILSPVNEVLRAGCCHALSCAADVCCICVCICICVRRPSPCCRCYPRRRRLVGGTRFQSPGTATTSLKVGTASEVTGLLLVCVLPCAVGFSVECSAGVVRGLVCVDVANVVDGLAAPSLVSVATVLCCGVLCAHGISSSSSSSSSWTGCSCDLPACKVPSWRAGGSAGLLRSCPLSW